MVTSSRQTVASLLLSLSFVTVACAPEAPSRYDQVQQETAQKGSVAVSKEAVNGGQFNRYFPKSQAGFAVVPAQEKKGFAEHKVNRGGKNVAVLSVNDTVSNPAAAQKFQQSQMRIGGFPAVEQGQTGTAVLVGDRFQVKAQSRDPSFTQQDRAAWLQKFDLNGLSNLK
jgi:hypothetical protein